VQFDAVREFDKAVQAQTAGFGVSATAPKTALRIGADKLRFSVQSQRAGHLYVLAVGPDGVLAQIVPNRLSGPVRLRAGQAFQFPTKGGLELDAVEPAGTTHFLIIVSAEARGFDALKPKAEGPINLLDSGSAATAAMAAFTGPGSVVAGLAKCPAGAGCDTAYGAAVLKLEAVR
jgi:hypothetical protein